jgi:hypothetical protein
VVVHHPAVCCPLWSRLHAEDGNLLLPECLKQKVIAGSLSDWTPILFPSYPLPSSFSRPFLLLTVSIWICYDTNESAEHHQILHRQESDGEVSRVRQFHLV